MPVLTPTNAPKKPLLQAIKYAQKCVEDGAPIRTNYFDKDPEAFYKTILVNHKNHNYQSNKKHMGIVISYTPQDYNKVGWAGLLTHAEKVVQKKYPNHYFIIGAHNDTDTPHVHLVIDKVNMVTGELIKNKFNRDQLRAVSDNYAKEMGIGVIKSKEIKLDKDERLIINKKESKSAGKLPYIKDMKQKADFALTVATDYSEYASLLDQFGIKIRIEEKNISYLYPDRKKMTRGRSLGESYNKEGLVTKFLSNQEKFKDSPAVKKVFLERFNEKTQEKWSGHSKKSLQDFKSLSRRKMRIFVPSDESLKRIDYPRRLINQAKEKSILKYAKENSIKLEKGKNGKLKLKGRPYVEVQEFSWTNGKNKTKGNIIDFVAYHKNVSYMKAIEIITGDKRAKVLNKNFNFKGLEYKSFHIPKDKRMKESGGKKLLQSFLKSKNTKHSGKIDYFLKQDKIQVSGQGIIRLLSEKDEQNAFNIKFK